MHTIRKAEQRDVPRLLDLLVQVNMVHHKGRPDLFNGPATKYNQTQLAQMIGSEDPVIFVWSDESDVVQGYAFCFLKQFVNDGLMTNIKTLYIDDLCVDEAQRGRHIGKELYDHVLAYAKSIGCYNMTLNVWALNEPARRFYERCGLHVQKYGMELLL